MTHLQTPLYHKFVCHRYSKKKVDEEYQNIIRISRHRNEKTSTKKKEEKAERKEKVEEDGADEQEEDGKKYITRTNS